MHARPIVTLYVRRDCHLCEEAEALLRRLEGEFGFAWQAVHIDGDPKLVARYGQQVPVLAVDGEPLLQAPLREQEVRRVLSQRLL